MMFMHRIFFDHAYTSTYPMLLLPLVYKSVLLLPDMDGSHGGVRRGRLSPKWTKGCTILP